MLDSKGEQINLYRCEVFSGILLLQIMKCRQSTVKFLFIDKHLLP